MKILDMGCGKKKTRGSIGIDSSSNSTADVIHDLNTFPYPFKDDEFDEVVCNHVLEHLDDIPRVIYEIHRMLKPLGRVKIISPHYTSDNSYTDITHKHHFSIRSFDYFIRGSELSKEEIYTTALFEGLKKRIVFTKFTTSGGGMVSLHRMLGIEWAVNKCQRGYEKFFAFIVPANEIQIELRAIKSSSDG